MNNSPKAESETRIGNANMQAPEVDRSVAPSDFKIAQNRFRMMDVEREILSYAIQRLYGAEADGKISKDEHHVF